MKILLVEDHADTSAVFARLLAHEGHIVVTACTFSAAKQACEQDRFDLLISDLRLPDGDGWKLMQEVAQAHNLTGIALSAHAYAHEVKRSYDAGFIAHLTKPIAFEDLLAAIAQVCNTRDRANNPESAG